MRRPKREITSRSSAPHSGQVTPSKSGSPECKSRCLAAYPAVSRPIWVTVLSLGSSVGNFRVLETYDLEQSVRHGAKAAGVRTPVFSEPYRFFLFQVGAKKFFRRGGFLNKRVAQFLEWYITDTCIVNGVFAARRTEPLQCQREAVGESFWKSCDCFLPSPRIWNQPCEYFR